MQTDLRMDVEIQLVADDLSVFGPTAPVTLMRGRRRQDDGIMVTTEDIHISTAEAKKWRGARIISGFRVYRDGEWIANGRLRSPKPVYHKDNVFFLAGDITLDPFTIPPVAKETP